MKTILTFLLLFAGTCIYAQSDSAEREALSQKFLKGAISEDDFSKTGQKWNRLLQKYGKYPELSLDQNGQVRYTYTHTFGLTDQERLFRRTLEWIAINYQLLPANLYSSIEDGKIILNNSFPVDGTYSCTYTAIISVKPGKMLVDFFNIGEQGFFPGHYSGDSWVSDQTSNVPINQIFPVVLKDPSAWNRDLELFKTMNERFKGEVDNLWDYLTNYDAYNAF